MQEKTAPAGNFAIRDFGIKMELGCGFVMTDDRPRSWCQDGGVGVPPTPSGTASCLPARVSQNAPMIATLIAATAITRGRTLVTQRACDASLIESLLDRAIMGGKVRRSLLRHPGLAQADEISGFV